MDRTGLTEALHRVVNHFGSIDVLEYGPTPAMASIRTVTTTDVDAANLQFAFNVLGAITAVQTVLPAMQARKDGAILFTTAVSAQHPVNMTANFGIAAGAQLNYARLLHNNLKGDNIYAGIVSIAGLVAPTDEAGKKRVENFPPGLPVITAQEVADQHWALYTKRDKCETIIGDLEKLSVMGLLK
jgi:NADP-dependent 3-hydroxy acid dehydrogenase YdfG